MNEVEGIFILKRKCYIKAESQEPRAKSQEQRRKDRRAEQPKSDRGHDGQHEQRRENGLPPEIRGERSVHALTKRHAK